MRPKETAVVYLRDGVVLTPGCNVLTSQNELLRESTHRIEVAREIEARLPDEKASLAAAPLSDAAGEEWALLLGHPRGRNYYQWWLDCLPRAWIADKWPSTRGCPLLMPPLERPFQEESLALLGWEDRVRIIDEPVERFPRLLFVTGFLLGSSQAISPLLRDWAAFCRQRLGLGASGNRPRGSMGRRIYISRRTATKRRVVNEQELIDALGAIGIESIESETLSLTEQMRLFSEAELVVAAHGAGLTNILFAAPGTRVIEILALEPNRVSAFGTMSALLSLEYGYLVAARLDSAATSKPRVDSLGDPQPNDDNIVIDPATVVRAARAALR
jgi:capsular polysaccharide biosynthesis protein